MALEQRYVEQALAEATKRGDTLDYFFDQLRSPEWVEPLRERGFFSEPPQQSIDAQGFVRSPSWAESRYLARVAADAPDEVLSVISGIQTDNERVLEDFVDAGLEMPIAQAERLAALIARWIREREYIYYALPRKTVDFAHRLATESALASALDLISALFAPQPAVHVSRRPSPRGRFSPWEYDHHLRAIVAELVPIAARETLSALLGLLADALDLLRAGSETGDFDGSRVWRVRIRDDRDRDSEIEEALTSVVRDASIEIRAKKLLSDSELVELLLARPDELFKRIAMHALAAEHEPDLDVARPLVVDPNELASGEPSPEFRDLLRIVAPRLTSEEIELLAAPVMGGPDVEGYRRRARQWDGEEPSDEQIERHVALWQIGRLALIADALPPSLRVEYDALIAQYGEAEIPVSWEVRTFVGPKSPRTADELAALDDAELLAYLSDWRQREQWADEPSLEGLARAMGAVTENDPSRISRLAPELKVLAPAHIQWILHGFELAVGNERSFDWSSVLNLLTWVADQPREIPGGRGDTYSDLDPGWVWTRREIAGLLERGLNARGATTIPVDERQRVWEVLALLLADPEPTPEHEERYGGQNMDPVTLSLNTSRPRALRAAIAYAIWIYHASHGDEESVEGFFNEVPEVRECLEAHLDPASDSSSAVRAVFGQHFANLFALDRNWGTEIAASVFPAEDSPLREAAWGAFVIFTLPYNNVLPILRDQYLRAAELASFGGNRRFRWMNGDPVEKLGEHIAAFVWRGVLSVDDPLLAVFWSHAPVPARAHMVAFLGRSAREAPMTQETQERLFAFWAWVKRHVEPTADASAILQAFGSWFGASALPVEWRLEELETLLTRKVQPEPSYLVAEQLPGIAEAHPLEAIRVLRALLHQGEPWVVDAWRGQVADVLRAAATSDDVEAVRVAQATLDWLLARGYREFRGNDRA